MSYGVDGFAFAAESLVGKYKGAHDKFRVKKAIRLSFYWGMALALTYSLIYILAGEPLLKLFTNEVELIPLASDYLFWMWLFPILGTPCYIWDGIYIGFTASKDMRNAMLWALVIYLSLYFILGPNFGNHGLWAALVLFMVARGLIQWLVYVRDSKGAFTIA